MLIYIDRPPDCSLYLLFSLHLSSNTSSSVVERGKDHCRSPCRGFDPCLVDLLAARQKHQILFVTAVDDEHLPARFLKILSSLYVLFSLHLSSTTSSSVVERGTVDPQVAGSIPAWWTSGLTAGSIPVLSGGGWTCWLAGFFVVFKFPALFHLSTPSPLSPSPFRPPALHFRPPALPFPPCPLAPFLPSLRPSFLHLGPSPQLSAILAAIAAQPQNEAAVQPPHYVTCTVALLTT